MTIFISQHPYFVIKIKKMCSITQTSQTLDGDATDSHPVYFSGENRTNFSFSSCFVKNAIFSVFVQTNTSGY